MGNILGGMDGIFKGEIKGKIIKEGNVVLIVVPAKKLIEMNTGLLEWYISEKKYPLVYVTVNKPFSTLIEHFQEKKIDTSKIFIIDAISPRTQRAGNAVFVGSPKELTNMSRTLGLKSGHARVLEHHQDLICLPTN